MTRTAKTRLAGVAFLLTVVLAAWLSIALYDKAFTPVALVTVDTSSVGNEMHPGAEVMVRGVQVGEVREVSANGTGARLVLAIQPGQLRNLPANVSAEMLPTTLFGERYVDLILPRHPTAATLTSGSVISEDRAGDALELDQVLTNLLPSLSAIQPDKLSLALTAIAQGLNGRGKELGRTLVTLDTYLEKFNGHLPQFDTDIRRLAGLASTYNKAAPDLLAALNDFAVTGKTLSRQRAQFAALLTNLTVASNDLHDFLDANGQNAIDLTGASLPTLTILARYSVEFPCNLEDLANFVPKADKVLGAGTGEPGLHVRVLVVPSLGAYHANQDAPVYGDDLGPHCYAVPFKGLKLHDGASPPGNGTRP